jgi:hypothetical protein
VSALFLFEYYPELSGVREALSGCFWPQAQLGTFVFMEVQHGKSQMPNLYGYQRYLELCFEETSGDPGSFAPKC